MKHFSIFTDKLTRTLDYAKRIMRQTGGKIATMPDLIKLRLEEGMESTSTVWHRWINPASMVFIGQYDGKDMIILAHHFGPLTSTERIETWNDSYSCDEGSNRASYGLKGMPKITQEEFNKLVKGDYGKVHIFDYDEIENDRMFRGYSLTSKEILAEPFLQALFGENLEEYLEMCEQFVIDKQEEFDNFNYENNEHFKMFEVSLNDKYGCSLLSIYEGKKKELPNEPVGIFLTLGRIFRVNGERYTTEIQSLDDDGNSRFLVLNPDASGIQAIDYDIKRDWKQCLVKNDSEVSDFFVLTKKGSQYFTQKPKDGARMDTAIPEYQVVNIEKVGAETTFQTDDCMFFLKYDIQEVQDIAPKDANAYIITGDVQGRGDVTVPIQFFKVQVDSSQRVLTKEEVMDNLPLLIKLNTPELKMSY